MHIDKAMAMSLRRRGVQEDLAALPEALSSWDKYVVDPDIANIMNFKLYISKLDSLLTISGSSLIAVWQRTFASGR